MLIRGRVYFCGTITDDGEEKKNISILVPADSYDRIVKKLNINDKIENIPIKPFEEQDCFILKAHSKYDVEMFENAEPTDIAFDEVGKDSEVMIDVKLGEGKYKGKSYQTLYLKGLNIIDYVEKQTYNPFLDTEDDEQSKQDKE